MTNEIDVTLDENDDVIDLPAEEIQWTHAVLNDFEMAIDALGIETIMFLMSKHHEDIINAWVKHGIDTQSRNKQ
jgi:hypothetical protein